MTRCIFAASVRPPPHSLERVQDVSPPSASRLTSSSVSGHKTRKLSSSHNPDTSSASNLRRALFSTLLCLALLLGLAAPAQAQQVLISNIGQTGNGSDYSILTGDFAQSFTTGGHEPGYTLSSVDLVFRETPHNDLFRKNNPRITVTIQNESGGRPGTTVLGTLTLPSSSPLPFMQPRTFTFAAPGNGIRLEPSTTYFVVLGITAVDVRTSLQTVNSNAENESGADGFTIGDSSHSRPNSNFHWTPWHLKFQIGINGRPVSILPVGPEHMPQIVLSQDEFVVEEPQDDNCSDDKVGDEKTFTDIMLDGKPGIKVTRNYGPVLTTEAYKVQLDRSPGPGKYVSVEIWDPTDLDRPDVRDGLRNDGSIAHTGRFSENARIHGISWRGGQQGRISTAKSFLTFTDKNWNKPQKVTVNIHCAQHDVTNPLPIWHFAFRHDDRLINPGATHQYRLSDSVHAAGDNRKGDNSPDNTSLKIAEVRVADRTEPPAIMGNVNGNLVLDAHGSGFTTGGKKMIDLEFTWNNPGNELHNDYDDAAEKFAAFRVKLRTVEPAGHPVQEKIVPVDAINPGDVDRTTTSWYAALEAKGHVGWVYGRPEPADSKYEWSVVPMDRRWNEVGAERVTKCVLLTSKAGPNGGRASRIDKTANPTCTTGQQGEGASAPAVYVPDTAVANVQITAVDDASASVTWDAVAHATSYDVSWDAESSDAQTVISGGIESVTGTTATIQHNAPEAMTLTVTVTPEYVDGNGQIVQLLSLAGTVTLEVGPQPLGNGGTNGGDGGPVRAGFGTGNGAADLPVPVSHWRFEDDAVDWVGSSHGTEKGGVAFEAGVDDHALSLDGNDDYVDLASHVSDFPLGDSTRSVTGWFKADAGNQGQSFFSYGPNVEGKRFSIAADRTQVLVAVSGHAWGVNGLELEDGWHHVAVTYAGGNSDEVLIYLDGELQSASTLAGSSKQLDTQTGPAAIGRNVGGTKHYTGLIDDVRLYDVALSAEQVLALFEEHPQTVLAEDNLDEPEPSEQNIEADDEEADDEEVNLPDPVAHWDFDNDAVDGAGSSHGTVSGGAAFVANEDGEGVGSHALSLDGSNDYVDLDLHISKFPLGDSTRSVSGWFKADTGSQGQTFFSYGPNVAGKRFSIAADRTQAVVGVSGYAWGVRNLSLTDGWHHIAVTFAGGDAKVFSIYLDGVLQSSELLGGFRRELDTKSGPASIGRSATGTKHYAGSIDDVRLYDVELSAEQVRALFDEHPQL